MPTPLVRSFIVLGRHDGAGLTPVSCALVRALRGLGVRAVGMKPVAHGRIGAGGAWHSDELRQLAEASALGLPPRALCAGLQADDRSGLPTPLEAVVDTFRALATWADAVVVDGADGASFGAVDLARALQLPFVYVAGGAAAVGEARALVAAGLECAGWLGERDVDMPGEWLGTDASRHALHAQRLPKVLELRG